MSTDGPAQRALGRRKDTGQELREHALPRAVRPDYAKSLAALYREVDIYKDGVVEGHAHIPKVYNLLSAPDLAAEFQVHLAPFQHRALDLVHLVYLALLVARLLDVAFVRDETCPELETSDRLL